MSRSLAIVAKDLRQNSTVVLAYLAISAVTTIVAITAAKSGPGAMSFLLVPLLLMLGMVVIGSAVQNDSPLRAGEATGEAYDSGALFAAKLILVFIVMVVALLGQAVALNAWHASGSGVRGAIADSAVDYGRWLLLAFMIAMMTPTLVRFVLTVAIVPAALLVQIINANSSSSLRAAQALPVAHLYTISLALSIVGALGCLVLLLYLYRSRDVRPRTQVAAFVMGALLAQSAGAPPGAMRKIVDAPGNIPRTAFRVEAHLDSGFSARSGQHLVVQLTADSLPARQRLTLIGGAIAVQGGSNPTAHDAFGIGTLDVRTHAHAIDGVTWRYEYPDSYGTFGTGVTATNDVRRAIAGGSARLGMGGRIFVRVPGATDGIALRSGSPVSRDGTTTTFSKWGFGAGRATVNVHVSSAPANVDLPVGSAPGCDELEFALVNDSRHEAVELENRGGRIAIGWLVLPGVAVRSGEIVLETARAPVALLPGDEGPLDDEWFRGARLVVTRWRAVGSYPLQVVDRH